MLWPSRIRITCSMVGRSLGTDFVEIVCTKEPTGSLSLSPRCHMHPADRDRLEFPNYAVPEALLPNGVASSIRYLHALQDRKLFVRSRVPEALIPKAKTSVFTEHFPILRCSTAICPIVPRTAVVTSENSVPDPALDSFRGSTGASSMQSTKYQPSLRLTNKANPKSPM
ncbi:hypothetical protein NL676_016987 [Syzygium grande]|nr:hypothetical protein NL676_016987 [Syzygium grande]